MTFTSVTNRGSTTRAAYLDGLRGIAAFAVVVDHFASAVTPQLATSKLLPLLNGGFAVSVFFVISGYVMSASSDRRLEPFILRVVKRYARLVIPMLAASFVAWILLALLPNAAPSLAILDGSEWTAERYNAGAASLGTALREPLYLSFLGYTSYLDPPMWTMSPEFLGSVLIFVLFGFIPSRLRIPAVVVIGLAGIGFRVYWLLCFSVGAAYWILQIQNFRLRLPIGPWIIFAAFVLGCYAPILLESVKIRGHGASLAICAIVLVGGLLLSPGGQAIFSTRIPQFLGKISFSLYLIHVPLLMTIFAALYVEWTPSGIEVAAFFVLFVATAIGAGWLVTQLIDKPVLRVLGSLRIRKARPVELL